MARRARRDEHAGAEVIGAVLLFGLFVAVIAFLNVTAVPDAGLRAEENHHERVLGALNGLQSSAEAAGAPGSAGATVSTGFPLSPERSAGQDFFSFFLATPARASGELAFDADYGNVTIHHYKQGNPAPIVDVGSLTERFPVGRLTFDPHPVFRPEGVARLENGGVVTTSGGGESMRFDPPLSVSVSGSTTFVTVKARVLNGTDLQVGGSADVRVRLETEAATLSSPAANNARNVTLRIESAHGAAWGAFLNETSEAAGLSAPTGYETAVARAAGEGGLDVVIWTVHGAGYANDVRLTTGLAVYALRLS